MTQVRFLGYGAGYNPAFGPTCAFFREGAGLYLMDCGTSAFERLVRASAFDGAEQITVFLSHQHADHVGSLGIMLDYCKDILGIRPLLVHPDESVVMLMRHMGVSAESFTWLGENYAADGNGVSAVFYPVSHVDDMRCFGYWITTCDDSFYFSGDANDVPEAILDGLIHGGIQRIYQDTASHASAYHCHMEKIAKSIPQAYRSRVYCVHLDTDCADAVHALGFSTVVL